MPATNAGPTILRGLRRDLLLALAAEERVTLRIAGDCMAPLVADGARVQVSQRRRYWPGDLLVYFAADGRLTAHRLIGAYWRDARLRLVTRADNTRAADASVLPSAVVGRVVGGECAPSIRAVPWRHRLGALGAFVQFAAARILARLSPGRLRPTAPK